MSEMMHYLLAGALTLGIVVAALFGTVRRGSQPLSPAEPSTLAGVPGEKVPVARGKQ